MLSCTSPMGGASGWRFPPSVISLGPVMDYNALITSFSFLHTEQEPFSRKNPG